MMCKLGAKGCALTVLVAASILALAGCERKEKVLDIETPGGEVEVERSTEPGRGSVDVDVKVDKKD